MIDFIGGMGRRSDKFLYTLTFLLEAIRTGDIRIFRLLFNLWLIVTFELERLMYLRKSFVFHKDTIGSKSRRRKSCEKKASTLTRWLETIRMKEEDIWFELSIQWVDRFLQIAEME